MGSRALKVIVNRVFQENVMAVMWRGRSGRLDFRFETARLDGSSCIDLVSVTFTHAGHGDAWEASFDDGVALLRESPLGSRDFWIGDFQVERRPILQNDIDRHRWGHFEGSCDALRLRLALPEEGTVSGVRGDCCR